MKIIFMGTPDFAVPTLKKLYDSGYEVQAVFTQPDKPKGRGYKLTPPPVKVLAQEHDLLFISRKALKKTARSMLKLSMTLPLIVSWWRLMAKCSLSRCLIYQGLAV